MSTVLAKQINTIIDEGTQIHFERLSVMRLLWINLLARKHPFLLGRPGTNKTRLIDWVCNSIDGAAFWEILCNNQLGLEDFFGPIDMVAYDKHNVWHRATAGYMPEADVIMLDEVFKANGSVLNPLLDFLVRFQVKVNSKPMQVPALMVAMASNEMPSDDSLGAFWDRRGCAVVLESIQEAGNFRKLLELAGGDILPPATPTKVDLADVQNAVMNEVPAVRMTAGIYDALDTLKDACIHPTDGLPVIDISDRRWFQSVSLIKASAYLAGRDEVDDDDLQVLRHFIWETPELQMTADKRVLTLASPQTAKAMEIVEQIDEWNGKVAAIKGQSGAAKAELGAEINGKLKRIFAELADLTQQAHGAGRSTAKIDEVTASASNLRRSVLVECLNVPAEAAARL